MAQYSLLPFRVGSWKMVATSLVRKQKMGRWMLPQVSGATSCGSGGQPAETRTQLLPDMIRKTLLLLTTAFSWDTWPATVWLN